MTAGGGPTGPRAVPLWWRELWRLGELAAVLGVSRTTAAEMRDRGLLPAPVDFNGSQRWRRREVQAWIEAGCPDPSRWIWRAVLPQRLEDAITELRAELADLETQAREARAVLHDAARRIDPRKV